MDTVKSVSNPNVHGGVVTNPDGTNIGSTAPSSLPLPTGAATSANQTSGGQKTQIVDSGGTNLGTTTNPVAVQPPASGALPVSLGTTDRNLLTGVAGFTLSGYDYVSLSYTGSNLTGVVFKSGGSGGTTIATLTLAYSGSTLTSVTKT